jgi:hypothetical protein
MAVLKWAGAIGLTHAALPMVGFIGGWVIISRWNLGAVVYGIGAVLLGYLIWFLIREATASEEEGEEGGIPAYFYGRRHGKLLAFWVPILYVSMDALLSGPGKTVLLDRYSPELAWLSFGIVGILVALITLASGMVSRAIHVYWLVGKVTSFVGLAKVITWAIIAELTLFSFFLAWCLAKMIQAIPSASSFQVPLVYIIVAGLTVGALVAAFMFQRIFTTQLAKAGNTDVG